MASVSFDNSSSLTRHDAPLARNRDVSPVDLFDAVLRRSEPAEPVVPSAAPPPEPQSRPSRPEPSPDRRDDDNESHASALPDRPQKTQESAAPRPDDGDAAPAESAQSSDTERQPDRSGEPADDSQASTPNAENQNAAGEENAEEPAPVIKAAQQSAQAAGKIIARQVEESPSAKSGHTQKANVKPSLEQAKSNSAETELHEQLELDPALRKKADDQDGRKSSTPPEKSNPQQAAKAKAPQRPAAAAEAQGPLRPTGQQIPRESSGESESPARKRSPRSASATTSADDRPAQKSGPHPYRTAPPVRQESSSAALPEASAEPPAAEKAADSDRPQGAADRPAATPQGDQSESLSGRLPRQLVARKGDVPAAERLRSGSDQTRFISRVARAIETAQQRGGEIRLRLSPPELGSLRLEVKLQQGVLTARVEAETAIAREALLENLPLLRERLAEQGVRIEQFDVDLMDRQTGQAADGRASGGERRDRDESGAGAPAEAESKDTQPSEGSASRRGDVLPGNDDKGLDVVI